MTPLDWGLLSLCDTSASTIQVPDRSGPDIVLVHGLGGGRETSWTAEDGTIWPRDILPSLIPDVRVFTFGYPGTLKSTSDPPTLRKIALELLQSLDNERRHFPRFYRPIMWVGHGLGGLLIKKAIMEARHNSDFISIYHLTFGVTFFSTPHHGLDRDLFSKMLMSCKPPWIVLLDEPPGELLDQVDGRLRDLEQEFDGFRDIQNLTFISVVEKSGSFDPDNVVVTPRQGILGDLPDDIEHIQVIQRDHIHICTFEASKASTGPGTNAEAQDIETGGFAGVGHLIAEVIAKSKKATAFDRKGVASLEWLGMSRIRPVRMKVEPTIGTCKWITQTNEYTSWKRETPKVNTKSLWIRGPVGSGKTHLSKHIWVDLDSDLGLRHTSGYAVAHCCVDDIVSGRRTIEAILFCLMFDILMAHPWLVNQCLVPMHDIARAARSGLACDQSAVFIRDLWRSIISSAGKGSSCLVLIVDGIDKCEHPAQVLQELLNAVSEVAQTAADQGCLAQFKLLTLSNRSPELDAVADDESGLVVYDISEEPIIADMRISLTPAIDAILSDDNENEVGRLADVLWGHTLSGDEKSHSWATILLSELRNFKRGRADLEDLLGELAPGDFTALYDEILGRCISGTSATMVQNLLFWVTHQLGPMTKEELRIACALSERIGYPDGLLRDGLTNDLVIGHVEEEHELLTIDHEKFDETLRVCAPLLRIASSSSFDDEQRFTVAHDSLREHIATIPPATSHDILATVCMNYLLLLPHSYSFDSSPHHGGLTSKAEWDFEAEELLRSYPFAGYAATRWVDHFTLASSSIPSGTPRKRRNLELLLNPGSKFLGPWTKVLWYYTRGREGEAYPMDGKGVSGDTMGSFPWASVFAPGPVELIERALLGSASEVGSIGPPRQREGNDVGESAVPGQTRQDGDGMSRNQKVWESNWPHGGGNSGKNIIRDSLRGRKGRVVGLAVVIVILLIIGGAVGGSQAAR